MNIDLPTMSCSSSTSSTTLIQQQHHHDYDEDSSEFGLSTNSALYDIQNSLNSSLNKKLNNNNDPSQKSLNNNKLISAPQPPPPPPPPPTLPIVTHAKFKLKFYKFLLNLTLFLLVLSQTFKVYFLQLSYAILIKYERMKLYFANKDQLLNSNRNEQFLKLAKDRRLQSPTHVCVILNEQIGDVRIILKTFHFIAEFLDACGVKYLTFYKFDGIPSEVRDELNFEFEETAPKDLNNNIKSLIKSESLKNRLNNNNNNNNRLKQGLKLNFLSYSHGGGKDILVQTCQKISKNIQNDQIKLSDINQDFIDTQIIESTDLCEPELILNIGTYDTLAGFSPWHCRLSEIIKISSYRLVNQITLTNIIIKYNQIEKRFGK
jgi:dehydrodolichyl diphosphate syntase complex subunit NUS1